MSKVILCLTLVMALLAVTSGQRRRQRLCQWGAMGSCRGSSDQCPTGSTCQRRFPGSRNARCCRTESVSSECQYGQNGLCGGIMGAQCPTGTTCMYMQPFADGAGKCCFNRPTGPGRDCPFGQDGICGGFAGLQCRQGTTCRFQGKFPDAAGKCCIESTDGISVPGTY